LFVTIFDFPANGLGRRIGVSFELRFPVCNII
jgi:hypothetical protein